MVTNKMQFECNWDYSKGERLTMNLKKCVSLVCGAVLLGLSVSAQAVQIESQDFAHILGPSGLENTQEFTQNSKTYHIKKDLVGVIRFSKNPESFELNQGKQADASTALKFEAVVKDGFNRGGLVYSAQGLEIYRKEGSLAAPFKSEDLGLDPKTKIYPVVFREISDSSGKMKLSPGFITGNIIVFYKPGSTPRSDYVLTSKSLGRGIYVYNVSDVNNITQVLSSFQNDVTVEKAQIEVIEHIKQPL